MISEYLDHGDEKKARRSLLTVATITLAAASMDILDGQVAILGLTIAVKQERLVALGQIASGVLLFVFLVRSAPVYIELLKEMSFRRLARQETRAKNAWSDDWHPPPEGEHGPTGEYSAIEEFYNNTRKGIVERFSNFSFLFGAMAILLVDFGLPITIGTLGTTQPYFISNKVDQIIAYKTEASSEIQDEGAITSTEVEANTQRDNEAN